MKKIIMSMLVCLVLVGCTNTKEVITEYTVKSEDVMPKVNEIDITSLNDRGNVIYPQRVVDDQMYFKLFNTPCYPCGTKGDYVDFYSYNLSTQGFEVSERTLNNQNGIPFNNGILVLNRTFYYSAPLDYSLMFYSKEGAKEIFSANKTYDIYRVFASEQFIYVGHFHYAEYTKPVTSLKVLKYDKEGKLVEEIEIPLVTGEGYYVNMNTWYIQNDEVKTFELTKGCNTTTDNLEYKHDSNKLILLQCSFQNQDYPYSAFDTTSQTFISLLPETMSDVVVNQVIRIDDDHLLVANVPKGSEMVFYEYYSFDPNSMSFGIYRISDNQYIPIKDENQVLANFFNYKSKQVQTHTILDFGLAYNQAVGIMKLSLDGSNLNAVVIPYVNKDYNLLTPYFEDNHLFLSLIRMDEANVESKLFYLVIE